MPVTSSPSLLRRLSRHELLWVAAAFVVAIFIAYGVLQNLLTTKFDQLERANVSAQADRVSSSLANAQALTRQFVVSNAAWTDAFDLVRHPNASTWAVDFSPQTMAKSFGFGAVVATNRSGRVVDGGIISADGTRFSPVSPSLARTLAAAPVNGTPSAAESSPPPRPTISSARPR